MGYARSWGRNKSLVRGVLAYFSLPRHHHD
jgi:hypothetical protein